MKNHRKNVHRSRKGSSLSAAAAAGTISPLTTKTVSKKRTKLNVRNSRYVRNQIKAGGVGSAARKLLEDSVMRDLHDQQMEDQDLHQHPEDVISATQRKIRAKREAARIANQAAVAMISGTGDDEDDAMEILSTGNGTTLGRPRVMTA